MAQEKLIKFAAWQPLSWQWPFGAPTQLRLGIWATSAPGLPEDNDPFWRWALSGREIENLKRASEWLCFRFSEADNINSPRRIRALELIRNTQLALQIVASVGCSDSTIVVRSEDSIGTLSTVHPPPLLSTPWGRITAFGNCSLSDMRCVVRGVHAVFHSHILRLINPLYFFQLGLESNNSHIRTFQWVSGLDALLMAGNSAAFSERLINILGGETFVLPKVDPSGQPSYRVGEVAADLYELRSATAHGQLIPDKFLEVRKFTNVAGAEIASYPLQPRYFQILEECALFLFTGVLRKIFVRGLVQTFRDIKLWRQELKHPH